MRARQLEYINRMGELKTDREFAEWLGVHERNLNRYLNGIALPTNELVVILANKLGPEVYDLVGWPRPAILNGNAGAKK